MYLFNALFITAILNIFIFIIEDSYHNAKSWGKKAKKRRKGPPNFNIRKLFDVLEVKTRSTRRQELCTASRLCVICRTDHVPCSWCPAPST